ncbi:MAG: HlyD family secretion protein, partial [Rhodoblastus sp.]
MKPNARPWLPAALAILVVVVGYYGWRKLSGPGLPEGIAGGNGRIEAVEIDISTKIAGRIKEIFADEGDFVEAGQTLAQMDIEQLESRRRQAEAELRRSTIGIDTARSLVTQRQAEREAAVAVVAQREAQLDAASRRLARSEHLVKSNSTSQQVLDDDRANQQGAMAAVEAAKAQRAAGEAAIAAAKAEVVSAEAAVEAARATIASIVSDI